ncbi:MAG TPA: hypothetical protein VEL74_18530 [Thermoanaerobaculia bacterium]|nr:hypothetical protein [Thermoanaerobaculia bacterium]
MPRIHPKPEVIDRLLELVPESRNRVLLHLCECPRCHELWLGPEEGEGGGEPVGARVLAWRPPETEYEIVVDRVLRGFQSHFHSVERERAAAPGLLEELRRHPPERRAWLIAERTRFRTLALVELLVRTSDEEVHRDAGEGERWGELALRLADRLDPGRHGTRVVEDARARCWASIGNARRVATDLLGADQAFRAAEAHLRQGSRDPLQRAPVLAYKASLRRAQRRFGEAISLLKRSISISLSAGDLRRVLTSLLVWVRVCQETGEPEEAVRLLRVANGLAGPDLDPRLKIAIRHNLLVSLMDLGRLREARALLVRSRALYRQVSDSMIQLRMRWLEAQILAGLGQLPRAVLLLDRVRSGFAQLGNGYEAALVSLELAALHARLGRPVVARRLAVEAFPIFRSRGVQREALAALILLVQPLAA